MAVFTIHFYAETPAGEMKPQGKEQRIQALDVDDARVKARELAEKHGLPSVRSVSAGEGGAIYVYCARVASQAQAPKGMHHTFRRPPGGITKY